MERKGVAEKIQKDLFVVGVITFERSEEHSTIHALYGDESSFSVNQGLSKPKEEENPVQIWA